MSTNTPDPIDNNTDRVLVRSTASGFEQSIAALAGFLTCGPIGALASWGSIRGLQGKWAPWFILGIPSCVVINIVNILIMGMLGSMLPEESEKQNRSSKFNHYSPVSYVIESKNIGKENTLISQKFLSPHKNRIWMIDSGTNSTCSYAIDDEKMKSFKCLAKATVEDGLINSIKVISEHKWEFTPYPKGFELQNYKESGITSDAYVSLSDFTLAEGEYLLYDDEVIIIFVDNYDRLIEFSITESVL